MSSAPPRIVELVETFDRNIEAYHSQQYNEAQLRKEFIDPFFEELGWDIQNKAGIAQAYKDVIHEDAIKIGGTTKAPDYCFRIGPAKKFFVEAKKPAVNIKSETSPAYQLRRYAWSAKLPLSILTDFEEFAVYDCQIRPNVNDKPSTARIFYCTYKDYADKWEQIANIFSKEAVHKGLFDKYASEKTTKRGTTTVDKEFLAEIEEWRNELAKNIAIRNGKLSVYDLNFAVQKTIDRILFLRICEDRGIERNEQLSGLINGSRIYPRLFELFEKADEKYNSGIFHFRREKDRPEGPDELSAKLKVDDDVLKKIIRDLYYPCPYEFSVMPAEILGQVYEQFLGKVIRLTTSHQAKVEEKPEVKKAGGVYYTPSYIVDYIVKNTVGKLCENKTPKQIEKLKILDPACGSGSFLIGAYQYLLDFHRDYYEKYASKHKKVIYQGKGKQWFLTIDEKKRILLNNIYGVDIDSQAAEVTKLSLLLKVLENETQESLRLFHERALPDLGNNIKCGNSLIGQDFYQNQQLGLFGDEQQRKINAFDWKKEFADVFAGKTGGFDAVIGNPPYGAEFPDATWEYLKSHFETYVWRGESYLLFVEKAISLLNQGGQFGYIIPDTYLNLGFTKPLRNLLLRQTKLTEVVLLPVKVFVGATVDTTLLFTKKTKLSKTYHQSDVSVKIFCKKRPVNAIAEPEREFLVSTDIWHKHDAFLVQSDSPEVAIMTKASSHNQRLSEYAEIFYGIKVYQVGKGSPPQSEKIRDTKPFTSDTQKDKSFFPMFDGKHIRRYGLFWNCDNWIKYGHWLAEPRESEKYEGEKLLIRKIVGNTLIATYFPKTSYCNTLVYVLKLKDHIRLSYFYLLGILASRFIGWYFRKKFQISDNDTFPQIMIRDILQFPIPHIDKAKHDKMVSLVDEMLELHKKISGIKNPDEKTRIQRQIDSTDEQIDKLVYELYELTDEEIAIVEGAT
ncbi:MAG: N-6 DNA methylase [Phycisphaerae bacterium]|jgi:type I restriction-modification system DNA methylase subunit